MKILAINGSHRGENGFTQSFIEQIKIGATESGADFETVLLAKHKINSCLGCEKCHSEETYLKCVYEDKDDMKLILDKIKSSDIIIYATPMYIFSISSLMKNFFDRFYGYSDVKQPSVSKKGLFFHHIDDDTCSKPFVILTNFSNVEYETTKSVLSYFKIYSRFMDAPIAGTLIRSSTAIINNKEKKVMRQKSEALMGFQNAGRELALKGKVTKKTEKKVAKDIVKIPLIIKLLMKNKLFRAKAVKFMRDNSNAR